MHTAETMKARCIEAMETWRMMRIKVGPSSKSGFWPLIPGEMFKDYAPETTKVIRLPTAAEIGQADEFAGWVNRYLDEQERKDVWQWGRLKTLPHRTIRGFCEKTGLREHEYRRQILAIFQKLASSVSGKPGLLRSPLVDDAGFSEEKQASSGRNARCRGIEAWRPEDARPAHLPESEQHKRLVANLLKRQRTRQKPAA